MSEKSNQPLNRPPPNLALRIVHLISYIVPKYRRHIIFKHLALKNMLLYVK